MKILLLLPLLITTVGLYFLFKLRFFYLFHPIKTLHFAIDSSKEKGALVSFSLALAGTLGVGNIVGVAVGLSVGGAGAVFWLLVSSLFSTVLKYCESSLSSEIGGGKGMIGIISSSFSFASKKIAALYASLILVLCFVMGAALQSASIGQCAVTTLSQSPVKCGIALVFVLALSLAVGAKKIEKITATVIPMTTVIYIFLCFSAMLANFDNLPSAFRRVFGEAFRVESATGGILGFITSLKIKEGYLRGLLSNEAGAGTSTIAHSLNCSTNSASVGVMGMLEVVFDTVILCMLTAFSALVCIDDFSEMSGIMIVYRSVGSTFGHFSEYLLFVSIVAFAYSTIVCWYYYGRFAFTYLFPKGSAVPFSVLFLFCVFWGCVAKTESLIYAVDFILLFLSLISLSALIKNSDRIKALSERCGLI